MLVDYEAISDNAKVWVYPSSRKFYATEINAIKNEIESFLKEWKKDDESFLSSYKFLYNRFIILLADSSKSPLTNSDIDASVSFILKLQNSFNVELLDRMNVCFKQGEFVQYKELKDFKALLKNKAVTGKTIIFDNLITNKSDLENYWEIPIKDSWYNRYLK